MKFHRLKPPNTFLLLFLHLLLTITISTAAETPKFYDPEEKILINCGSTATGTDEQDRRWSTDDVPNAADTLIALPSSSSVPAIPYLTARIFPKEFTYPIPVTSGRKFLRLYFYPSNYSAGSSSFASSDALFDVTVGKLTLLKNFSAHDTALALNYAYIQKEYSMNVTSTFAGFLNLTFTPSSSSNKSGSYAFINGIEIVSVPDDIVPTETLVLVGTDTAYDIDPAAALETVVRFNVGGKAIDPTADSGLFRSWLDDLGYVEAPGVSYGKDENVTVGYTKVTPSYIAPPDVYGTARSMGPDVSVNRKYNLTWKVPVDAGFYYLVRLHFCEIQYPIMKGNMRVFDVFINDVTAISRMDVISETEGIGIPVRKDLVVVVPDGPPGKLAVELHPNEKFKAMYYDAILNGLEVFKISRSDGLLAGPNPVPRPKRVDDDNGVNGSFEKKSNGVVVGGGVGGSVAFLVICVAIFVFVRQRKQSDSPLSTFPLLKGNKNRGIPITSSYCGSSTTGTSRTTTTSKGGGDSSTIMASSGLCHHFFFSEIEAATNRFDEKLILGVGGFGKVYQGTMVIDDKKVKVAIKRANPSSDQGVHEFQNEIELLSQLRHRHLVSLIGSCEENGEMILVYDYMANGTLREHLYKTKNEPLSWTQRLEICIGAARGLHYLHTGAKHSIIHRDVKTTNILLDDKWVAKVSDFGLSKTGPSMDATHVSTFVKGSFGYMDPEYFKRQQLTDKSDVYSFGVVLFEVLCGRPALLPPDPKLSREEVSLAEWALHCKRNGKLEEIVDRKLKDKIDPKCYNKFVEVAQKCLAEHGVDRPTIGDVLWTLELALQLQQNSTFVDQETDDGTPMTKQDKHGKEQQEEVEEIGSGGGMSSSVVTVDSQVEITSSVVFSQMIGDEGR